MKRSYIQPRTKIVQLKLENVMGTVVSTPGGVGNGGKLGNEYSSTDQDYSRQNNSLWDDEE